MPWILAAMMAAAGMSPPAQPSEKLRVLMETDAGGDRLAYRWYVYPEPGTYRGAVRIRGEGAEQAVLDVPADAAGKTIHVVLEATDSGAPPLTRYRRVVVTGR